MYSFIVEMAPLDQVPHAIHLFLEQVDHGLLNGTYFYLNGPHIVQSGPQLDEEDTVEWELEETIETNSVVTKDGAPITEAAAKSLHKFSRRNMAAATDDRDHASEEENSEDRRLKAFSKVGLDRLAFPDYSPDFPHTTWTLGYTGRPGGPDWYINKVDNTKGHGPGGQFQHALEEQGDSCFGKVEPGKGREDLSVHLFGAPIYEDRSEWHYFLIEPREIVGATVITKKPDVQTINMGKPLRPQDFSKHESFDDVLQLALDGPAMDPVESSPNASNGTETAAIQAGSETIVQPTANQDTSKGPEKTVETEPETKETSKAPDSPGGTDTATAATPKKENERQEQSNEKSKTTVKRKPRLPKIEGAAEA